MIPWKLCDRTCQFVQSFTRYLSIGVDTHERTCRLGQEMARTWRMFPRMLRLGFLCL